MLAGDHTPLAPSRGEWAAEKECILLKLTPMRAGGSPVFQFFLDPRSLLNACADRLRGGDDPKESLRRNPQSEIRNFKSPQVDMLCR